MQKLLIFIVGGIVVLVAGFFVLNNYIYNEKQKDETPVTSYRGTLSGEYVCLPHVDQNGPQTMECALGLKTDSGEYYAVDLNAMSQNPPDLQVGDKFTASGTITPVEMLSSDQWRTYPIEGIFSITDSLKKL